MTASSRVDPGLTVPASTGPNDEFGAGGSSLRRSTPFSRTLYRFRCRLEREPLRVRPSFACTDDGGSCPRERGRHLLRREHAWPFDEETQAVRRCGARDDGCAHLGKCFWNGCAPAFERDADEQTLPRGRIR